jgi:hypothetical protein
MFENHTNSDQSSRECSKIKFQNLSAKSSFQLPIKLQSFPKTRFLISQPFFHLSSPPSSSTKIHHVLEKLGAAVKPEKQFKLDSKLIVGSMKIAGFLRRNENSQDVFLFSND